MLIRVLGLKFGVFPFPLHLYQYKVSPSFIHTGWLKGNLRLQFAFSLSIELFPYTGGKVVENSIKFVARTENQEKNTLEARIEVWCTLKKIATQRLESRSPIYKQTDPTQLVTWNVQYWVIWSSYISKVKWWEKYFCQGKVVHRHSWLGWNGKVPNFGVVPSRQKLERVDSSDIPCPLINK